MKRAVLPALVLVAALGVWELYVDLGSSYRSLYLPAPHAVAAALYTDRGTLWSNFVVTAREVLLGVAAGIVLALVLSIAIHFSTVLRRAVLPLLIASQAIPIPVIAPLLVIWLGFGLLPKLEIVALVTFFPVVITTLAALEGVDPELLKLLRTFDASRPQTFYRVELPAALPGVFTGAKLAAVFSVIAAVLAEQAGANSGLGYLVSIATGQLLAPEAFAAVVLLCVFAIGLFALFAVIERRALPWAHQSGGTWT